MCDISMSIEKYDEIWSFVEHKLNLTIPTYFKNVLKVCGYNNGITIASIEDEDIEYLENEVKNGNVEKYFRNVDEEKVLEDCTMAYENFMFTMGHRKLLTAIADFLKKHFRENGPNSFSVEQAVKKKCDENKRKHEKFARQSSLEIPTRIPTKPNVSNIHIRRHNYPLEIPNKNQNEISIADLKIQQGILICKTIMSLINITPSMYAKHMDSINKTISNGLVRVEMTKNTVTAVNVLNKTQDSVESSVVGIICCPLCLEPINVPNFSRATKKFSWDTAIFDLHVRNVHLKQVDDLADNIETDIEEEKMPDYGDAESLNSTKTIAKTIFQNPGNYNSMNVFSQGRTRENSNEISIQKSSSLINLSNTSVDVEKQQQEEPYSEIVTRGNLKESNEEFRRSEHILNSKPVANNVYSATNLNEDDQNVVLNIPEPGQYVICSLSVKNCLQWPAKSPIVKNFVGRVGLMKECKGNKNLENIPIKLLKKSPYSNRIFHFPENVELSQVPKKKIVKTLEDPLKNRRGEYVFKDKSLLDYVF